MINKKAQGLPVNVVVMMIIGIIIFGIGMALFTQIYDSSDDQIEDWNNMIKNDINSLECPGDDWICIPNNKMNNGEKKTFQVYIANRGDSNSKFYIDFPSITTVNGKPAIEKAGCGSVQLSFPPTQVKIDVDSGNSASIPFIITANRVSNTPCNFLTTAVLKDNNNIEKGKTTLIVRVE